MKKKLRETNWEIVVNEMYQTVLLFFPIYGNGRKKIKGDDFMVYRKLISAFDS